MSKYLVIAKYTADGAAGVLRDGGSGRESAVTTAIEGLGGSVDCFYFALGEGDVYAIVDLPDGTTDAIAFALAVAASGTATTSTIALSTAEEVDRAARKTLDYRAPVS
jgi:uncharacterized protein with GYD domain